jgi:replicative DNA helicase
MRNEIEFIDDLVLNKGLPSNIEAERSILGAILLNNDICYQAIELLKREDFFLDTHRRLFDKMILLTERSTPIDLITLSDELKRANEYEQIGGATYISELISGVPRTDTIEPYAKIIKSKARLRQLIKTSRQIAVSCYDEEDESDTIIEKAEQSIFELGEDTNRNNSEHVAVVAARYTDFLQEKCADPSKLIGLSSGYQDIDTRTLGFTPGVSLIAARPSQGKTSLALNIACNVAFAGGSVYFASVESAKEKLISRILAAESKIDSYRLRQGRMDRDEFGRILDTLGRLSVTRFEIDDSPDLTAEALISRCRQFAFQNGGLDLVLVDYIQLMLHEGRIENRREEVRKISKGLVKLSRLLKVPVIALAQLSREVDKRPGNRPQKSDLGECSALEADADVIMFILREEEYNRTDENRGKAKIIFGKNRDGATDEDIDMVYISQFTRFEAAYRE